MPIKRLLYFTSQGITAYRRGRGSLVREDSFDSNEDGVEKFSRYVASGRKSLFYVLADVVEEDFFQENIPFVRGGDRRALLARKLAQRYRDTRLALSLSLGTETGERREERILHSSFTNTQQFQPWLDALRENEARVAGVFSVALMAPRVVQRIGFKAQRYLLVSLQQAGLRQSFVENGCIRFSRLGRIDQGDPRVVARTFAEESERIQQYLTNMRTLARENLPLDVVVLAPGGYKALYDSACADTAQLRFHVFDLDQTARKAGLKSAPEETLAEGLFLHTLGSTFSGEQFAGDDVRRFYDLWRARVGLIASSGAAFALCLAFSGLTLLDIGRINVETEANRRLEAAASSQYAKAQENFPKTPIPAENFKAVIKNYRAIERQIAAPGDLMFTISRALTHLPQIELDRIDWSASGPRSRDAAKSASAAPAPAGATTPIETLYRSAEISGRLIVPDASDYRNISTLVAQFVEALRTQPGIEVIDTHLPFDINAQKNLSGDIGTQRSATEVPRFSVLIGKRIGT